MKKILFSFIILFSVATFGQKKYQNQKGAAEIKVEFMGESKRLDAITPVAYRTKTNAEDVYIVPNKLSKIDQFKLGPNLAPDPVMQKSGSGPLETQGGGQVLQGFDGGSNADNAALNGVRITPPDTQGDVGPNHYVQMVNLLTTIYDKQGNTLLGPIPSNLFFQDLEDRLAMSNNGDPVVLYDQFADRWIISQFSVDSAPFAMLIAVSTTPDPLGTYNQYAIFYGDDFPDYPKLGIWNDGLYITTRDFNPGFIGFSIVAVNKDDIVSGVAEPRSQRFQILNPGFDGILPADADGDLPPPAGQAHPSMFMGGANELNLVLTSVDFDNPDNSTLTFDTVPIAPFNIFTASVPQPNGQVLDALPNFLMYRLQYRNFGTHASITTNHSVQEVAGGPFGVRWYEFRDTGAAPWEVFQQGTFMPDDGLNRWMGSIAMNGDGDIALGYSVSSADLDPSIRFAGQTASESGSGILNIPEASILEGTASITGASRWGDYAMMSVDPVDEDFWFTTEYVDGADGGAFPWATFIAEMTFGDPPVAICQDVTVDLNADDGTVTITPEQINNGSTDATGGNDVTLTLDIDTFDCNDFGENIVTLTVTDAEGITASCTAVVTVNVIDEEAPVAVCQDITVQLDGESVEITPEQVDGGSTDNCAIAELAIDQTVFTETGEFTVTLTVTDPAGLTDTCEATVIVAVGPVIEVDPLELDAAVDVSVTDIPVDEETFTITNNGGVPLDFDIAVGGVDFTPEDTAAAERLANLDRSIYRGNGQGILKSIASNVSVNAARNEMLSSSVPVADSLFLDSGVNDEIAPSYVGLGPGGGAFGFGVRLVAPVGGFNLNAVRNNARTEDFGATDVLIQVYGGDALPDPTQLLTEQLMSLESVDGTFPITLLDNPQQFEEGEVFWIVPNYPMGIAFPQGFDDTLPGDAANYAITLDGGATFANQGGFAILVRAIDALGGFITLAPESGSVEPGESVEVTATFDATGLPNGVFESDILVNSNDVNNPEVTVATTFTVSGVPADPLAVLAPENVAVTAVVDQVQDVELTLTNAGDSDLEFSFPAFAMASAIANGGVVNRPNVENFPELLTDAKKGFVDTRTIEGQGRLQSGTDLEFGYTWLDSDAPGGPMNNFMDITATGTDITADLVLGGFSDGTTSVGLPFAFPFYGEDQSTLFINGNGLLAFQDPGLPTFTNNPIPSDDNANNIIAPFWDDLEADGIAGSSVHVDANAERVIVQWTNAPAFLAAGTVTFQVVLFPDGTIDMYYEDVETADFLANSTIGIENADGSDGALVTFNMAFIRDDFAIRFTPPSSFITNVAPLSGTLAPGAVTTLAVTVDATGFEPGVFTEDLMVSTNSVDTSSSTSTFELTVVDSGAVIEVDPLELTAAVNVDTDNPPVDVETFTVTNTGGLPLEFTTEVGESNFTPADAALADKLANLDRSLYGLGNPSIEADLQVAEATGLEAGRILAGETVLDSLLLDSGREDVTNFVGFGPGGPAAGFAIRFVAPAGGFNLNAVRNAARTEDFGAADILLQVFGGDALPDPAQLLTEQLVPIENDDIGTFDITLLNEPQQFEEGEVFWVVHNYPMGIDFPQGFDETLSPDDTNYAFTSDGGVTFANIGTFAFLTRALNVVGDLITLSPEAGVLEPGESVEVEVTFDGAGREFGVFETDIDVNSNDLSNPTVTVATTFTVNGEVAPPAAIEVDPLELTAEVEIGVDNPPVDEETFSVTNVGGQTLDFNLELGTTNFTAAAAAERLANLDRSLYGLGNTATNTDIKVAEVTGLEAGRILAGETVLDSLLLDSGREDVTNFVGFGPGGPAAGFAIRFVVPAGGFDMNAVRNAVITEDFGATDVLLQVFGGDALPDPTQLLTEQLVPVESVGGSFDITLLNEPQQFEEGEVFWVVHNYPMGIDFPQGFDETLSPDDTNYAFTSDGGVTFANIGTFAFLTRALNVDASGTGPLITLSPESGEVAPGETVDITVTFNGANLANGLYESDITVSSNDPINPEVVVATAFTVSGQTSSIEVSEELLLFNDVFVGNTAERTLIISNTSGAGSLNIASITSDNDVFSANPSSGTVGAGQELEVVVAFSPTEVGSANGLLTIVSDADNNSSIEVVLNGVGVEGPFAILDPEQNFVTLPANESTTVDITLRNDGASPLVYSFPEFTMANAIANGLELQSAEVIDFPNFSATQSKGFEDTRIGATTENSIGADLEFGYTWIDSDEQGGPVPNFLDISAIGSSLDLTAALIDAGGFADGTASLDLPFSIPFYGEEFSTLFVNANGFVSFEAPTAATFTNGQIPFEDGVNNIIAPFWHDLEPGTGNGGTVHIAAFQNAVVVQWTDAPNFGGTGTVTFQVVIFIDGTIDVQYEDVSTASFLNAATVGIENSGATDGAQVAFNTAYVQDNFAVRFMPPSVIGVNFITAVTPISGVLGVGQEETITVTVDAATLEEGVFQDQLVLSSNSVNMDRSTATFELTVTEAPDNEPDDNTNLGLAEDAVLSGSVGDNGRGSLEEILFDPSIDDYFVTTAWNEYGVGFRENLGTPGPEDGFQWRVDWASPKSINYITFGGTYSNQRQPDALWEISYFSGNEWIVLDEGVGGWIDRGIFEWDGRSEEPIVADALRVRVFSDGENDLVSIHLRGRGGRSFRIDDSNTVPKATLIQFLPFDQIPPEANFDFVTDMLSVDFDASSSTDEGTIVGYSWDFGDGTTGAGETTLHTYAEAGDYLVTLTVTDDDGITNSTSRMVIVRNDDVAFDNEPDSNTNLGLADDAVLSGSVSSGRGTLEEILFDPSKDDYFITTPWNEYGVNFRKNLGTPGPEDGFEWRVDWIVPKAINYITFGGTYPNQPQPNALWEISYFSGNEWIVLDEGVGGWIDRGIFEWDGRSEEPIVVDALRVRVFSDGEIDLVSIHLRGRGGRSFRIDDSDTTPRSTLIQYLPEEDSNTNTDSDSASQEDANLLAIELSPNPSTDRVEISISQGQGMLLKASLVNLSGQVIYSNITCDFRNKKSEFLDVARLTRGLYILVLTDENGNVVAQEKLVKN